MKMGIIGYGGMAGWHKSKIDTIDGLEIAGVWDIDETARKKAIEKGLTVYQKLILQVLIALGFFYIYMRNGGQTSWVVGTLHLDLEMSWLYGLFILYNFI